MHSPVSLNIKKSTRIDPACLLDISGSRIPDKFLILKSPVPPIGQGVVMRVFIVCALVAGVYIYYALNHDNTAPIYSGSGVSADRLMSECIQEKQSKASSYAGGRYSNIEAACANEHNVYRSDGAWRKH